MDQKQIIQFESERTKSRAENFWNLTTVKFVYSIDKVLIKRFASGVCCLLVWC